MEMVKTMTVMVKLMRRKGIGKIMMEMGSLMKIQQR